MPLNKQSGNMYPWVTHTWNVIKGRCPHDCVYCYMKRFPQKPFRFDEKEFRTNLGSGNTIFVGSSCDMWAEEVSTGWIMKILEHCKKYPDNTYLFQSKNPARFYQLYDILPKKVILGTTLETNRDTTNISKAPPISYRSFYMWYISNFRHVDTMISIEPIMDFDLGLFVEMIDKIRPKFVSIGADSKGHNLPEPPAWKVEQLIIELKEFTEVRVKENLNRILEGNNHKEGGGKP